MGSTPAPAMASGIARLDGLDGLVSSTLWALSASRRTGEEGGDGERYALRSLRCPRARRACSAGRPRRRTAARISSTTMALSASRKTGEEGGDGERYGPRPPRCSRACDTRFRCRSPPVGKSPPLCLKIPLHCFGPCIESPCFLGFRIGSSWQSKLSSTTMAPSRSRRTGEEGRDGVGLDVLDVLVIGRLFEARRACRRGPDHPSWRARFVGDCRGYTAHATFRGVSRTGQGRLAMPFIEGRKQPCVRGLTLPGVLGQSSTRGSTSSFGCQHGRAARLRVRTGPTASRKTRKGGQSGEACNGLDVGAGLDPPGPLRGLCNRNVLKQAETARSLLLESGTILEIPGGYPL
jgi:hypothetical protein